MQKVKKSKKRYESGHAKLLESLTRLIAVGENLDQNRLDPPADLSLSALRARLAEAAGAQAEVGNARADWRTIALERALEIEKFAPLASQVVGQLEGRGAGRETIEDAMFYVRKLQGKRAAPKPKAEGEALDESEKGVSASQQSAAALLSMMQEFVDFVEAQPQAAGIKSAGLTVTDLRAFVETVDAKHRASITASAGLAARRGIRNKLFYLDADNICDLAARYKGLVRGAYGAASGEFRQINSISFKRAKL